VLSDFRDLIHHSAEFLCSRVFVLPEQFHAKARRRLRRNVSFESKVMPHSRALAPGSPLQTGRPATRSCHLCTRRWLNCLDITGSHATNFTLEGILNQSKMHKTCTKHALSHKCGGSVYPLFHHTSGSRLSHSLTFMMIVMQGLMHHHGVSILA
jgi:hypothetical protein